jgi:hypothetical protein
MESVTIQVKEDKFGKDGDVGEHALRVYELFGNNEQIVFQDTFHKVVFTDNKRMSEIFLSLATRFTSTQFTE